MKFTSLKDMMKARGTCPICTRPLFFGFQIVNGRAFIKYSQGTNDVFMNIDIERNQATYNSFVRSYRASDNSRPSFRGLTRELIPSALNAECRTPLVFIDGMPAKYCEYGFSYDINLNHMKNRVTEVVIGVETYRVLDGYNQYEIQLKYSTNETIIKKLAEWPGKSEIKTLPINYFLNMTTPSRMNLLRKIKTIMVMKEK